MKKVLVVSAHPDDETLGVGGSLLKHKAEGDQIYWLNITGIFEHQGFSFEKITRRENEIDQVKNLFGFEELLNLKYPTMSLSSSTLFDLIPDISNFFNKIQPEIIYLMNRSDAHSDHRIVFDAVMACTKSFRYPFIKRVLMYECISETEFAPALIEKVFLPNYFVDISDYIDAKINIMKIYESELGEHPFPRSLDNIKALAHFRGTFAGVAYAEAFQLIKYIS